MIQYYKIAGIIIKMDCVGRTAKQAEKYRADEPTSFDFEITPELYRSIYEKHKARYPDSTEDESCYMCTGTYFHSMLSFYNAIMIHSSAVVVDGRAYLFAADPGTGKSTHTSLWLNQFGDRAYILNDDKPVLRYEDGKWYAYGTPWSGKHDISVNARVPLGGIAVLERGTENKIELCSGSDIPDTMMNQVLHSSKPERIGLILDILDKLLSQVPVWRLQCNMDPEAAIVSYEAMSGEKFKP